MILGVSKENTDREIKAKYKKLLIMYHPDSDPTGKRDPEDDEKIRQVIEAYRKIRESDRNTRRWLAELGWSVLHISNSKALALCTICKSRDTLLTTLTESWFTTATS